MNKLKLTYIPFKHASCIQHPHYDLHTVEKNPSNVACILTDKTGAKLIRKWIQNYNRGIK
jgi:hypothetical protein